MSFQSPPAAHRSAEGDILDTHRAGPAAVRGGTIRVAGYAAGVVLTVGSSALVFRHLGVVDSGRYVTVLALTSLIAGVTDIGLTTIGIRELAVVDPEARRRLIANVLGLRLVLTLGGVASAVAFAALAGYDHQMITGALIAGLGVVTVALQVTLGIPLLVQLRLGWVTLLELLRQAVLVAGLVVLVISGAGLLPLLAMQAPAGIAALVLTGWLVRRHVPLLPSFKSGEWRLLLREILPFAAATVVAAIYFRAALIVLGLVSSPTETGYFSVSFRVIEVLLLVPNLLVGAAFPILARGARDDHSRLAYGVDRVFHASILLGACVMVGLVLGAPFVTDIVAGHDFAASADVLRIQAVALMMSFAATALFYAMLSLRMHGAVLAVASILLVVNVVLAALLGSAHGAVGAALATLAAELLGLGLLLIVLLRSRPALVPGVHGLPGVAVATAAGLAVWLIPGLPSMAAATLGIGVFAAVALLTRTVPPEFTEALLHRQTGTTSAKE